MKRSWAAWLLAFAGCTAEPDVIAIGVSQGPSSPPAPVFHVSGAQILDPCGHPVILRGVNEMAAYVATDRDGTGWVAEVRATGGNALRFWWRAEKTVNGVFQFTELTPTELGQLLTNAENDTLTPIPTIHNDDGDFARLNDHVTQWLRPAYLAVWKKHEAHMLLNISDALGDQTVNGGDWLAKYSTMIWRLRNEGGLRMPIVVDAPAGGMQAKVLLDYGGPLLRADPEQNVILSFHMFWRPGNGLGFGETDVATYLGAFATSGLPLLVTEFAPKEQSCLDCPYWQTLMTEAAPAAHATGWLAWSWGAATNGPKCPDIDITNGGLETDLTTWGTAVVESPNGIRHTTQRTYYQNNRTCN
jgi:hypothetical protein